MIEFYQNTYYRKQVRYDPDYKVWYLEGSSFNQEPVNVELECEPDGSIKLAPKLLQELNFPAGKAVLVSKTPYGVLLREADPAFRRLYIEPTNSCNLKCKTCIRRSWSEKEGFMDFDLYQKIIASAQKIPTFEKVSFWGWGEPLLHPRIVDMIAAAKGAGAMTQMITNGMLLTKGLAEVLVQTGLDSVIISIDSPEAAEYARIRPGADLTRIIENIRALVSFRNRTLSPLEVGLEFVATKSTVKHLPRMRALAGSIGADFLFVTNVLPYEESYSQEILYSSTADYGAGGSGYHWHPRLLLPPLDNQADSTEHVIGALQKGERLINSTIHSIVNRGRGYCRFVGEGSLAVSWNGEMSPCIALMHNYTCYVLGRKKSIKKYVVGNIKDSSIREIWEQEEFKLFRKRVQRFDFPPCTFCGTCERVEANEEDCFYNPFPVCGDCLWAQGVIQCP
ncbi:MAG: radical SAM protein [Dethiobacteria bacterium]|jgi:MoaA/NifB/PqqE/SkfB family radical SAM enzyme